MRSLKRASTAWPVRIGAVAALAAAGLASATTPSLAAAVSATATPGTGAAGAVISLTTTTANTFRNAANVSQVGAVQFSSVACPTTTAAVAAPAARTVPDAVAYTATTVTASNPIFTAADVGATISGTAIPSGATITAYRSATEVGISAAATAEGTTGVQLTVGGASRGAATDGITHDGKTITSAGSNFLVGDASKGISGTGIPAGTTIATAATGKVTLSTAITQALATAPVAVGTAGGPYAAASFTVVSGTKLIVKAPAAVTTVAAGSTYNICVYNAAVGVSGSVTATATYKVYPAPTITTITPNSGPALGGTRITIAGTAFSSTAKATVDNQALGTPTVDTVAQTISGTVPSHSPGAVDVVVTTEGGPVTLAGGYTYMDGISTTPSTTTSTSPVVLDIFGAGFTNSTLAFTDFATPNDLGVATLTDNGVASTDTIAVTGTNPQNGDRVRFAGITGTTSINSGVGYFVVNRTGGTFQVASTPGGSPIDVATTGASTATYDLNRLPVQKVGSAATVVQSTGVWTQGSNPMVNGDRIMFSAITGITNITPWTWYYVVNTSANTFKVATTPGGTALALTGADGGAQIWWSDLNTHVVIARGAYDDGAALGTAGSIVAECGGVTVASDTELICTLDAGASAPAPGSYQVVIVDNLRKGPDRATIVTSPSTFTVAPY